MTYRSLVALSLIFLTGCAGIDGRLGRASTSQGELEATQNLPELPAECRRLIRSGVRPNDRLDTALLRTDAALSQQHSLTRNCAAWYDELREEFSPTLP